MSTPSHLVSSQSMHVLSVIASASSQMVPSDNANHRAPVQVFAGHQDAVICVCFYPNERKLVSGSGDGTLRIWDRNTGMVQVLSGHTGTVWDVDVTRDGKMLVSGGRDGTVRIWNGESGETMHVFEGHERLVRSVGFSRDSTRVVSGSNDGTVRVWSAETGELAFKPIECHGLVDWACYSPSGDRIASGAKSIQIWNAETGTGTLSIRNSEVTSVVWTDDGTHLIGDSADHITIWNSHSGERLRTWKAHDNTNRFTTLSLSPTGTHLATSNWREKRSFVFDISTGQQVTALEHGQYSNGIAYSPSGKFIATGCDDKQVYIWEAPVFEDPQINARKSRPPSFSWFLDRPAVPPAGPSRNDTSGLDGFWDSLPNRDQQALPPPRHIFNKVKDTFTSLFTRRPAGPLPKSPARETVEPVEVAAERDKVFWIVIERTVWTPLNTFIFMAFYCRKPGPAERMGFAPINQDTKANSSQVAATRNQPERQETVHGAGKVGAGPDSLPTIANNSVIRTQPEYTAAMSLSGAANRGAGPGSLPTSPESIEMVTRATPYEASSSVSPNIIPSSTADVPVAASFSPEGLAVVQQFQRHKAAA